MIYPPDLAARLLASSQTDSPPFSQADTDAFIRHLASHGTPSGKIYGSQDLHEMLRTMARVWLLNPTRVYDIAGTYYWRLMTHLALDAWAAKKEGVEQ